MTLVGLKELHGQGRGGQSHLNTLAGVPRVDRNLRDQAAVGVLGLLVLQRDQMKMDCNKGPFLRCSNLRFLFRTGLSVDRAFFFCAI